MSGPPSPSNLNMNIISLSLAYDASDKSAHVSYTFLRRVERALREVAEQLICSACSLVSTTVRYAVGWYLYVNLGKCIPKC